MAGGAGRLGQVEEDPPPGRERASHKRFCQGRSQDLHPAGAHAFYLTHQVTHLERDGAPAVVACRRSLHEHHRVVANVCKTKSAQRQGKTRRTTAHLEKSERAPNGLGPRVMSTPPSAPFWPRARATGGRAPILLCVLLRQQLAAVSPRPQRAGAP